MVGVGDKVNVAVAVCVAVGVLDGVDVAVAVSVGVLDGVDVDVDVAVCVAVGVTVELPASVITNWGGWLPWREEKVTPSVLSAASTKQNVPFPATKAVTSYSTQDPALMFPLLSTAPLVRAGRLFQVMPVSVQDVPVEYTAGPLVEPFVVSNTRSRALWTVPDIPVTVKWMKLSISGSLAPSTCRVVAFP